MATLEQKKELIEVLKFTPRTYKISMWGYGGEIVMGTIDKKVYDYFKHRRLSVPDYSWDSDYAEENNIPEDMHPFYPGQWHDCDNMAHAYGVSRNAGTVHIEDENGEMVYEKSFDDFDWEEGCPDWCCNDEVWIDAKEPGTVVFIGRSNEKGTFFEGEIELTAPFDISKLELHYDEIDGEELINSVIYDGVEIDNWGGSTDGKSSDFSFYIAGSQKENGNWEKYATMDDIQYSMTDWFPAKVKPILTGVYNVKTKDGYSYQAKWTGKRWINNWHDDEPETETIKIKEWQGIDHDPDEDLNWDPVAELDKIVIPELEPKAVWPFAAGEVPAEMLNEKVEEEEMKSKIWTIKTYYKKSCEQHEYYTQPNGNGKIKIIDGYRFAEYTVETNDGEFPQIEFTEVPGGNGARDSINLNDCFGSNVESTELIEVFDGGCWGDVEITGIDDEDEVERLQEFISENGAYALEDEGDWYLDETEVWVWGPLEISDEEGNTRIVCADEDGNMIDFVE